MNSFSKLFEKFKMFCFIADSGKFEKIKKDRMGDVITYYLFTTLVFGLAWALFIYGILSIIAIPSVIIMDAVFVAVYYGLAKLLGGNGSLHDMARVYAYGSTPAKVFGWIPCIGIFAALTSIGNYIQGTMALFKLSRIRAVAVVLLPIAVILAILLLLMQLAYIYE